MKFLSTAAASALLIGVTAATPAAAQSGSQNRDGQSQSQSDRGERRERDERRMQQDRQRQDRQRRNRQANRGRLGGEVVKAKKVDIKGSDRQAYVVLLKNDNGKRVAVDLGDDGRLGENRPQEGDQIRVYGTLVRIGDRLVLMGEQLQTDDGQRVRVERPKDDRNSQQTRRDQRRNQRDSQQQRERSGQRAGESGGGGRSGADAG